MLLIFKINPMETDHRVEWIVHKGQSLLLKLVMRVKRSYKVQHTGQKRNNKAYSLSCAYKMEKTQQH